MGKSRRHVGRLGGWKSLKRRQKFGDEGNNLTHDWEADPDGQEFEATIESYASATGRPDLLDRVRAWRQDAQRITEMFLEATEKPRAGAAAPVPMDR